MTREEKIQLSIEMYEDGCTMREIMNEVGMSDSWIRDNMPGFQERKARRIAKIKQRRQAVVELWNQGMRKKDIAEQLEMSVGYVTDTIARERAIQEKKEIEELMKFNALQRSKKAPELPKVEYKGKIYRDVFYQIAGW